MDKTGGAKGELPVLYHSFPRFSSEAPRQEISAGVEVLRSLIDIGLILSPETLYFPHCENDEEIADQDGSEAFQKRVCFTYVREAELVKHCALFGAFALEFDIVTLRQLGAMPVMYLPQPVGTSDGHRFDHFANNVVHQIRDVATLLEEIADVENLIRDSLSKGEQTLIYSNGDKIGIELDIKSIEFLLEFLKGKKGSYRNLVGYVNSLASLIYHVDSSRLSCYFRGVDLEYYKQMEWRIISGLRTDLVEIDRELSNEEVCRLMKLAPLFRKPMQTRDGRLTAFAKLSRAITRVDGKHILELARCVWVPDVIKANVESVFEKAALNVSVSTIPYALVLQIRADRRAV